MTTADVVPTLSPSMDIQVSSNFERLLFEMNGRDGGMTAEQLHRFRAVGRLDVEGDQFDEWIEPVFRAASFDDDETLATIAAVYGESGMLLDPQSAVALARRPCPSPTRPADGDARDCPSGEVPRCGRAGDGHPAPAARPPGRPLRPPGADVDAAERPRGGGGIRDLGGVDRVIRARTWCCAAASGDVAQPAHHGYRATARVPEQAFARCTRSSMPGLHASER